MKEYLKYLRAIVYAHFKEDIWIFRDVLKLIYETFFTFANRVDLFDDMEIITEINRLHMDLQAGYHLGVFPVNFNYRLVKTRYSHLFKFDIVLLPISMWKSHKTPYKIKYENFLIHKTFFKLKLYLMEYRLRYLFFCTFMFYFLKIRFSPWKNNKKIIYFF